MVGKFKTSEVGGWEDLCFLSSQVQIPLRSRSATFFFSPRACEPVFLVRQSGDSALSIVPRDGQGRMRRKMNT